MCIHLINLCLHYINEVCFTDIQKLQLMQEIANITAKNAICKLKTSEIERQITVEKECGRNIDEITPVKFTISNGIDQKALSALIAAKSELQKFYLTFNHSDNYEGIFD